MARIIELTATKRDSANFHKPVTKATIFEVNNNNEKLIQIDTYGSDEREIPDKISQSIQFSKECAKTLLKFIKETYPDL